MIGSIEELKERAIEKIDDDFDLHKPYIDNVHLTCPSCGKKMNRIPDVLDCWFDSGSMPFAQYHYPFENKELFEEQFPADFIAEGIDQTRGWFYTLLIISTFLTGKSPFKNVLVNDLLLDAEGKKMSKSRGNIVEPFTAIKEYGADTVRFYLPYVSPVWTPLKFNFDGLKEVYSKFFNPLKNTYSFFAMYANIDGVTVEDVKENFKVDYKDREEIDKWLLSKYNRLVLDVTNSFEEYDINKVVHFLADFVSEDLSNWYIRRNRDRFWGSDLNNSKKSVYLTTFEVLEGLSRLIAPICPFLSEEIYRGLTDNESVHLTDYPVADTKLINEKIEEKMDLVRDLISLGRQAREDVKIKVRQPISEVILDGKCEKVIGDLTDLIKEELNVHEVNFTNDLSTYMSFEVKPNFKEVGKLFGPSIKEFQSKLMELTDSEITSLSNDESISMEIGGKNVSVNKDMVEIRISSKEGFDAAHENNNFIVLNTNLTDELIDEGIVRELISKVQNLRKTKDFNIVDRINIYISSDEDIISRLDSYIEYIKKETLCVNIINEKRGDEYNLNGINATLDVERV
jgi:isoleucyl-tRNA synthetase